MDFYAVSRQDENVCLHNSLKQHSNYKLAFTCIMQEHLFQGHKYMYRTDGMSLVLASSNKDCSIYCAFKLLLHIYIHSITRGTKSIITVQHHALNTLLFNKTLVYMCTYNILFWFCMFKVQISAVKIITEEKRSICGCWLGISIC